MPRLSPLTRLRHALPGLLALATFPVSAAGPQPPSPAATAAEVVGCAEARHKHNMTAFAGYSTRLNSIRQGYTMEGKLEEDFRVVKTVKVTPKSREETFIKGEKNGKPADVNDFWLEKLGMSKKYTAEAMNIFAPEHKGKYDFAVRGLETVNGRAAWKLSFKVKKGGEQELQKGNAWVDQATCGVIKAEGNFPKVWVVQDVKAEIALTEVKPGLWLPARQQVDLVVQMPIMKRRGKMIDEFSAYQVNDPR